MPESNGHLRLPTFEYKFNIGHVFTFVSLITVGTWTVAGLRSDTAAMAQKINEIELRGAIYIPRINAMDTANQIQDERLANVADALKQARQATADLALEQSKINSQILLKLGDIRESVAMLTVRVVTNRMAPTGTLAIPIPPLQPENSNGR